MSLGAAPAAAYTCNILGTCSGTTVAQQQLFANLQRELNRVRAKYGLAPDVTVDGKIGTTTVARLIKLGYRMLELNLDTAPVIDRYGIETSEGFPTTAFTAANALSIYQALQNNGLAARNLIEPAGVGSILDAITPAASMWGATIVHKTPVTGAGNVQPQAMAPGYVVDPMTPTAYASPGATPGFPTPKGLWVGLAVLGGLAVAGFGVAIVKSVRR